MNGQKMQLKGPVQNLASDIGLLYKLSNRIRKASRAQNTKAAKAFVILNDEGTNVEDFLKAQFTHIIQDRFPHTSEFLSTRLADTMLFRRKRILYRRSRYSKTPSKSPKQDKGLPAQLNHIGGHSILQPNSGDPVPNSGALGATVHRVTKSRAATATTLTADGLQRASAPSITSVARTIALADHEDLVFPSPPVGYKKLRNKKIEKSPQGEGNTSILVPPLDGEAGMSSQEREPDVEVICPFCFLALSSLDVGDKNKWTSVLPNTQERAFSMW